LRNTRPSSSTATSSPSRTTCLRRRGASSKGMPAASNSEGPKLGYRPVIEGAVLTTARTLARRKLSAATSSRSGWAMTAISPGFNRGASAFVRCPNRTLPRITVVVWPAHEGGMSGRTRRLWRGSRGLCWARLADAQLQAHLVSQAADKRTIGRLAFLAVQQVAEGAVNLVQIAAGHGHFDGVADCALDPLRRCVVPAGHRGVQLLGDGVQQGDV